MPDYENGKIYKLWSFETDDIYIGSTTQPLSKRLSGHKKDYKRYLNGKYHYVTSFKLIEYDDCKIELLEYYPCDTKEELVAREGYFIRTLDCVNKFIAGRTQKEYYENNKEYHKEQMKEWRENNKDYYKDYYENNKDKFKEYKEEYNKLKINCECGSIVRKNDLARHKRSKRHQNFTVKILHEMKRPTEETPA